MKILFINTPEPDYLQDLSYSGLCKVIGAENVIDWPFNIRYHIKRKVYPRNLGLVSGSLAKRIFSNVKKYDLVIVASCTPKCFNVYKKIQSKVPDNVPVVFVDGGDYAPIGGDLSRLGSPHLYGEVVKKRPFNLIFKREFLVNKDYQTNIFPLPFSANMDRYREPTTHKKFDISFWAVESDPIRTKALSILEDRFDCRTNGTVRNQIFSKYKRKGNKYLEELSACHIVLNFRGAGWDTLRYWEVPAMKTFMISQKPGIVIPNNFENKNHVVYCKDDLSDLVDLCHYYLKNSDEREKIANAGHAHLQKFHTDTRRAEYLLKFVKDILKVN